MSYDPSSGREIILESRRVVYGSPKKYTVLANVWISVTNGPGSLFLVVTTARFMNSVFGKRFVTLPICLIAHAYL